MGDGIKQGNELRRAAQEAILALFNLNTPQVTVRLANLPQEYQVNNYHIGYAVQYLLPVLSRKVYYNRHRLFMSW